MPASSIVLPVMIMIVRLSGIRTIYAFAARAHVSLSAAPGEANRLNRSIIVAFDAGFSKYCPFSINLAMNCPNCQYNNPDGARFCSNCGAPLSLTCSNCGASLQPGARFCHQCGQPVPAVGASPPPTPPSTAIDSAGRLLQRYIPKELLAKLESARDNRLMQGERRVVTILFCDVQGSSLAASGLDPEEWAEIINGAFEHMISPIYRYEGTVARLQGDGLLAFFGAPVAHEDDPQRGVLAGLDIAQAVGSYGEQVKNNWNIEFDVRVGLNTGLVVVGEVGSDLRVEYSALGDAINMAAHMEQNAQRGAVLVAEPTYKLVAPLFDFEVIEGIPVKGRQAPVTAYRALRRKASPGSLRGLAGLKAPLIGRKDQIDVLWTAAEEVQQGRGQILSVIGEAGLGKSRLVTEWRQALAFDPGFDLQWLEGHTFSYDAGTPYAPFANLFSSYFELSSAESDSDRFDRVLARLEALFPGRGEQAAPFIASLLGLPLQGETADRVKYLEAPQLREQIFSHVLSLVERLLDSGPAVLYLDDLHWADTTSIELLQSLLALTDRKPLMIVTAFRPRRQEASWGFHEMVGRDYNHRYHALVLNPLDEGQTRELVANILVIDNLSEKVRTKILEKAEGNPFFVEEVIRSLLDRGLVIRVDGRWKATREIGEIVLPDTLVGVITTRLDRLDDFAKHILQSAAVLGREFPSEVLEDILETPNQLEPSLVKLQQRELVREVSRFPVRAFSFKHVLTQEAAYNSILLSNRRELHRRAAEALIARSPEDAAAIARHLLEARQSARAVPFLVQAGDRAARAYASEEATGFCRRALELKEAAGNPAVVRQAYEGLGHSLAFTNRIPEALETYREMLSLAESSGDILMKISALNKLASLMALHLGQFEEAEQLLEQADDLSRRHNEKASIPEASLLRCQMCTARGEFERVVVMMNEVTQIGEELGNPENIALGLEHIATSLVYLAEFDEAVQKAEEGLSVVREIGDRATEAWLLGMVLPFCYMNRGDLEAARASSSEGLRIADRIGALESQVISAYLLSLIARLRGEYEQALSYGRLSLEAALPLELHSPFIVAPTLGSLGMVYLEISERFRDKVSELHLHALRLLESPSAAFSGGAAWADLGHCAIALGDLKIAEEAFEKGLNYPNTFSRLERPRHLAGAALLASIRGDLDEALRLAEEGRAYARQRGLRCLFPLTSLVMGKILIERGDLGPALAALRQAREDAQKLGIRPAMWWSHAEALRALESHGKKEQAQAERAAAIEIISEIAGLFEQQDLRDAYLASALDKVQ